MIPSFLWLGIVKTHNLAFIECETLQAVFSKDMCPNQLTAQPRYFMMNTSYTNSDFVKRLQSNTALSSHAKKLQSTSVGKACTYFELIFMIFYTSCGNIWCQKFFRLYYMYRCHFTCLGYFSKHPCMNSLIKLFSIFVKKKDAMILKHYFVDCCVTQ